MIAKNEPFSRNLMSSQNTAAAYAALVVALLFFTFNVYLMNHGHFLEDAYILFIYAENIINGNGITYFPSAAPIEGATDFLWLMLITGLGLCGLDVGTAAILLNSLGVFIVTYIIGNSLLNATLNNRWSLALVMPLAIFWVAQPPLFAAVGGFSVFLYMAMILVAFSCTLNRGLLQYLPYISIAIALFRPDGVILGVGFSLVGLYQAYKYQQFRQYSIGLGIAMMIGVTYFIWRYNYFDNLLPLPLYVKSHSSSYYGLDANITWANSNALLIICTVVFASLNKKLGYYFILFLPVLALFIALSTAEQSQNVDHRFQAPIRIVLYYIFAISMAEYLSKNKIKTSLKVFLGVCMALYAIDSMRFIDKTYDKITSFNSVNQFAAELDKLLPNDAHILLTEAGKVAYWTQGEGRKVTDLVGLNSLYPAKNIISIEYIESLKPDLIMLHHVGTLDSSKISEMTQASVFRVTDKAHLNVLKDYTDNEKMRLSKVILASIVGLSYLQKHLDEYDVYLVDYTENKRYSHVYAFNKKLGLTSSSYQALLTSFKRHTEKSFYDMYAEKYQ